MLVILCPILAYIFLISQQTIQQIQSRIDIIEIVGSFVKLKKRGSNYLGLCPFHNEKTPSFTVSPTKEIYKCFGCGKSGNTIGFLMDLEKYSYVEALRWLANKYNVEIEETAQSEEQKQLQQSADSLYIINNFAQQFFSNALLHSEEGKDIALAYLKERGFREDIIKKFQLGYNPSARNELAQAATAAQYNPELLQKSGLVVMRDGHLSDNYQGRIIFPIHNQSGKVLGFGARVIKNNDKAPKYINTPENEIYIKSRVLYGSYFARMAIDKADECLLVEGYTDVVSLHQSGIENVVASGGTSLTPDQLRLIKKYTNNLTIIYDGDSAGVKAALRGLDLAIEEGLNVKLVLIPGNEDPDSYVHKIGAEAFRNFIKENKKDFILFQLEAAITEAGNDSTKKAALVNQMAETISKINKTEEFTKRQDYIKQVSEILKIEEAGMNALVNKLIRDKVLKEENRNAFKPGPSAEMGTESTDEGLTFFNTDELNEQAFLRSLIEFGNNPWDESNTVAEFLFTQIEEFGADYMLDNTALVRVFETYKKWYEEGLKPTAKNFLYHEDRELNAMVINLMDYSTEISHNWKERYEGHIPTREELFKEEVLSTLNYLKLRKIKRLIAENQTVMEKSTNEQDQMLCVDMHIALKKLEKDLTGAMGTVIFKI